MTDPLTTLLSHPAIWRASRVMKAQERQQQGLSNTPTGFARLDQELPDGGWPREGVIELLTPRVGHGEMSVLMPALAHLSQQRLIAWIKPPWIPYAPALVRRGINIRQVLLIDTDHLRDSLWALEQCLHSGACAAALCWPESLPNTQIRRLHLAAQRGQALAILMRSAQFAQTASAAPLRLELGQQTLLDNGQIQCDVRIIKRRGSWPSDWFPIHWRSPLPQHWQRFNTQRPLPSVLAADESPRTSEATPHLTMSGAAAPSYPPDTTGRHRPVG